ncbi:MAG TPA: prepilin-type N-terminal cleavage/methylation domain-containing protein [Candidatus Ozemobacteraceae bacterium]|nr:prepilin-type N-terminal cleavage/methylation domain-containing protein [Candidatus Ozemobacteraceae bacterium]
MHTKQCRRGFTLMEIIIASIVMVGFFVGVYKVYSAVMKSAKKTNWSLSAQQWARNGLTLIREEMQRASDKIEFDGIGKSTITPMPFKINATSPVPDGGKIAEWYICIPFKNVEGTEPGAVLKSTLTLQGGKVTYERKKESGDNSHDPDITRVIMENVGSFSIDIEPLDVDFSEKGKLVKLGVELKHPSTTEFPDTRVIEETAAKVEVEVTKGL